MEHTETPEATATGFSTGETKVPENEIRGCCSKKQEEAEACCDRPLASCCSITIMTCCCTVKGDSMGDQTSPKISCLQLPRKCIDLCQQGCCVTILCDGVRKKMCLSIICSMNDAKYKKCCGEQMGCCKGPLTSKGCCKKSKVTVATKSALACRCGHCKGCGDNTKCTTAETGCSMQECCASLDFENVVKSSETKEECSGQKSFTQPGSKNTEGSSEIKKGDENSCCKDSNDKCCGVRRSREKDFCTSMRSKRDDGESKIKEEDEKSCCEELKKCCCNFGIAGEKNASLKNCYFKSVSCLKCCTMISTTVNYSESCKAGCCVTQKSSEKSIAPVSCCTREGCMQEECTKACCKESAEGLDSTGKSEDEKNREDGNKCCSNPEKPCRCSTVTRYREISEQCNCDNQENNVGKCKKPCCQGRCSNEGETLKDCTNESKESCCQCKYEIGEDEDSNCCCETRTNEAGCSASGNGIIIITGGCCNGFSKRGTASELTCCDAAGAEKDSQHLMKICCCKPDDSTDCDCKCDEECTCENQQCNSTTSSKIICVDCKDGRCRAIESVDCKVKPGKNQCRCCIVSEKEPGCQIKVGDKCCNDECCRVLVKCCGCANRSSVKDCSCMGDCCRTSAGNDRITKKNCRETSSGCLCNGKERILNCRNLEVLCCCVRKQVCCNTVKSVLHGSPMDCSCRTTRCGDNCSCYGLKKTHINTTCCCCVLLTLGCCTITIKSRCNCCSCRKTCCLTSSSVQAPCQTEKNCCCISANDKSDDPCGCKRGKQSDCCNSSRASDCCKA